MKFIHPIAQVENDFQIDVITNCHGFQLQIKSSNQSCWFQLVEKELEM
jgi:hypothetical protein